MIKCIAIDDEPIALDILRQYCRRRGGIELEAFSLPRLGLQRIAESQPDLVLLDIEMNDVSGLSLARQLPPGCCLIFTTAYAHYALDGFEANAIDFLHKPFFYERFCRAIDKAEQWLQMRRLLDASRTDGPTLTLKSDYKNVTVAVGSIVFIESIDNYVKLHLADGGTLLSKMPLYSIESQLPPADFLRIHRSFIVARCRVSSFTRTELELKGLGRRLPIGKKYAADVARAFRQAQ